MRTVLHLQRKFTSKTETFIVNQINTIKKFKVIIGTIINTNYLSCNKTIVTPKKISFLSTTGKYLSIKTAKELRNTLSNYKFDLIHIHYLVDAYYFLKLVKYYKIPKIVSCYGYDVSSFPNRFFGYGKILLNKVFQECDYFLAMSQDMANDLLKLGCPESKIIIHYYGTDTSRFYNSNRIYNKNDKLRLLMVGTVEEKKAQHLVIKALSEVVKFYNNLELHIVGDGEYIDYCKNLTKKLGLNNIVFFHGYVPYYSDKLINFYNTSDIFLLPSITLKNNDKEGIPGTIVEAMASGLPIISTFHAGIPYIIKNGYDGILVNERDIHGLANAIINLISDKDLREYLGRNAQKKAIEELDLIKGTEKLEKIYERIIYG